MQDDPGLWAQFLGIFGLSEALVATFFLPWRLYQIAIILGLVAAAQGAKQWIGPRMYAWMRTLDGRPKWQLRALLLVHQRLLLVCFVVLAWAVFLFMQQVTWPSRSFMVEIAALIATAWLTIAIVARLIASRPLRRLVTWSAWIWVTFQLTGFWPQAEALLDAAAIEVGDFRLSVLMIIKGLFITIILFLVAQLTSSTASRQIQGTKDISPSMRVLLIKIVQVGLYGTAIVIGLNAVGVNLTSFALLSGAIGVGLGFGLQKVVSNLVSGVILLLDKSIKPGDVISLGETFGWIDSLGARYVSVVTRDGKEYLIPNEDLITTQVVNWSHSNDLVRLDIYFGTAYGDDPHAVRRIAIDAAKKVDRVRAVPAPVCHIVGFGDSSVDYILRFWITDPSGGLTNVRGNVFLSLWDAFRANGISIPFPQREVRMLEGSVLRTGPSSGKALD